MTELRLTAPMLQRGRLYTDMGDINIAENINQINGRIESVCTKNGRDISSVKLIAVSKMNPAQAVREAYDAGQRMFGENKVQELEEKLPKLPEDIEWHLIGHLQTNKVKKAVALIKQGSLKMIHSVDSLKLAECISKEACLQNCTAEILLEVNIAAEESKYGFLPDKVSEAAVEISGLKGIRIRGLMCVAPFTENPETNRFHFAKMKELSVDIASQNIDNVSMDVLSMGMTGDFEIAVEEGATLVRVGTAIFGARNYTR